ncbi:MAG TPA: hypothetical protein VH087_17390 [Thermoanaerobaculia bacterium]|nr:hypothetical protein [Thermoanaerobaculia bacterium]
MRPNNKSDRRCTYVVALPPGTHNFDLRPFAEYLSTLGVAGCEVMVLDSTEDVDEHRRSLRWVGRHIAVHEPIDVVRTAADLASGDKIIVAGANVRYDIADLTELCALLDAHEVVEAQDYLEPMPWWGGIDAGRMLVHRGIDPHPDRGATFGFRRPVLRGLRGFDATGSTDPVRVFALHGAEVISAGDLFVRRCPPQLGEWLRERPREADLDFDVPAKSAFFLALIPMAILLTMMGGGRLAIGYTSAVAFASIVLAVRGRMGAGAFFPLRACLFAPLWVLERAVSVYWALLQRMRGTVVEQPAAMATQRNTRVASGE